MKSLRSFWTVVLLAAVGHLTPVTLQAAQLSGTLKSAVAFQASDNPVQITAGLTIASGGVLTLNKGVRVEFAPSVGLTVQGGGRLVAEGTTEDPVLFTRNSTSANRWSGLVFAGGTGVPEGRFNNVRIEFNGTTAISTDGADVTLEAVTFGSTDHQYLSLDRSSFLVSHCYFPSGTTAFELLHGTGGIKAGGRGIIRNSFFGSTIGYNDVFDFTGGNRPGQQILQVLNNVFTGSSDDILDLDGTDAWVEGNIFLHCHRNGSPDSSSAVSGGSNGGQTSEITIIRNIFYDCDNAATAKEGNYFVMLRNTVMKITSQGGQDLGSGVINLRDTTPTTTSYARGCFLSENVIADVTQLIRNALPDPSSMVLENNLLPVRWSGAGTGNLIGEPGFVHPPNLEETGFKSWKEAQIMREWLSLKPGSPALGASSSDTDLGALVHPGVELSGIPSIVRTNETVQIKIGPFVQAGFVPADGWPAGAGYTHYKWRFPGGNWSLERPSSEPIVLTNPTPGQYSIEVVGRRDSGDYQDSPDSGDIAQVTRSKSWRVLTSPEFGLISLADGKIILRFTSTPLHPSHLEFTTSLEQPRWSRFNYLTSSDGDGMVRTTIDKQLEASARFYRIVDGL